MKRVEDNNRLQMMSSDEKGIEAENKKQSWKPFFHLLRSVKLPWALIIVCTLVNLLQSQLGLLFPQYTEKIYAGDFSRGIAGTAVAVVLGKALCMAVYQYVGRYTSHLNQMRFQNYIWRKLSRLPLSYFEKHEPRDLISRTTEDTLMVGEFLSYGISRILSTVYGFAGAFILIFGYDWRLAASMAVCLPLCYIVGVIAGRYYFKMNNRLQGKLADMTRYFSAVLPYITLVKLFGQENREEKNGEDWIERYYKTSFCNTLVSTAVSFATTMTTILQTLVIILMGVWLVRDGSIDIGDWIAFYMYANMLNNSFTIIMNIWGELKRNQGCCARIAAVTGIPAEENPGTLGAGEISGDMEFRNITFAYHEKKVLDNVSFTVPYGKMTAVVGPSGAGKSTILHLAERLYTPDEGQILWGQKAAGEYELHSWRRAIGYIPQDAQLFAGTIRENIMQGVTGDIGEEQVRRAAMQADALEFIESFEKGFDTEAGENGTKLSGGQRQRIAIARALLMNARILILDEATSNLDAEAEYAIGQTLKELRKDHTILMVAHRMDTVKDADQIIVMEHTRIQGSGTHEELMQSNELYRQMVDLQAERIAV